MSGQYQVEVGQTNCLLCFPGLYSIIDPSASEGTTSSVGCKTCPQGYQHKTDRSGCEKCVPGKYQREERQGHCELCHRNKYQDDAGQIVCKTCPAGQYQHELGQSSCSGNWDNSIGCPYNPHVAHIDDYKTDCEMSPFGTVCSVVCQEGFLASGVSTCAATTAGGWSVVNCSLKIVRYKNVECVVDSSDHSASCKDA